MLKITRKVEYALIALRHLQRIEDGQLSSTKEIADTYGIPQELLAKILQHLGRRTDILFSRDQGILAGQFRLDLIRQSSCFRSPLDQRILADVKLGSGLQQAVSKSFKLRHGHPVLWQPAGNGEPCLTEREGHIE